MTQTDKFKISEMAEQVDRLKIENKKLLNNNVELKNALQRMIGWRLKSIPAEVIHQAITAIDNSNNLPELPHNYTEKELMEATNMVMKDNGKLMAIKFYKDATGTGLKEAKEYCDQLQTTKSSHEKY